MRHFVLPLQLKTAPADRGSFFARGATNSAETMAYYYISALPGSQLVLSSVPDEGTDAPGSETRHAIVSPFGPLGPQYH